MELRADIQLQQMDRGGPILDNASIPVDETGGVYSRCATFME
jgi:hypothetical protein